MWNELLMCKHSTCADIQQFAQQLPTPPEVTKQQSLLTIPQTLKCDTARTMKCGPMNRCNCTSGVLRAVEAKMDGKDESWKTHGCGRDRDKNNWKRNMWKSYNTSTTEGHFWQMSDRLLAIQKVAKNYNDECDSIPNPFFYKPPKSQAPLVKTPVETPVCELLKREQSVIGWSATRLAKKMRKDGVHGFSLGLRTMLLRKRNQKLSMAVKNWHTAWRCPSPKAAKHMCVLADPCPKEAKLPIGSLAPLDPNYEQLRELHILYNRGLITKEALGRKIMSIQLGVP